MLLSQLILKFKKSTKASKEIVMAMHSKKKGMKKPSKPPARKKKKAKKTMKINDKY